jgi:DNA invertase Pin-like site-specific DNA recombinase
MIAALYLRKSTDEGDKATDAKSVTRQRENGAQYATAHGWTVDPRYIYSDDGISGAEFDKRPGLQALLAALSSAPPFQVLIVSETSRLGRNTFKTLDVIQQLTERGVRLFSYLDDRELTIDDELGEMNAFMQTLAATMERRKHSQRAVDTSVRKAKGGYVTGGRTFGYTNVRGPHGQVDRVINDLEAAAVRQVFTRFATGEGLKKIATALNQAGITPPRPSKSGPAGWSPSTLKAVLVRTIYNGRITWNQTKKRDKSGRKAMTKRAASEWVVVERPDLQIIDDNLWSKVQDRLMQNAAAYLRSPDGKLRGRPPGSSPNTIAYLLTGLGTCAICQGSMAVRTSFAKGQRLAYLECLTRRMKGSKICSNALVVPLKAAEEAVLRTLDQELFRPDRILRVVARVVATLTPDPTTLTAERTRLKTESLKVERELAHLTTAVAAGGDLPALLTALKDRETALAGLRTTLTQLDKREALAQLDHGALEAKLSAKLADFANLQARHPAAGRSLLQKVLQGKIVFTPVTGPDRVFYRLEWLGYIGGLLTEELAALAPRRRSEPSDSHDFIGGGPNGTHSNLHDSSA